MINRKKSSKLFKIWVSLLYTISRHFSQSFIIIVIIITNIIIIIIIIIINNNNNNNLNF